MGEKLTGERRTRSEHLLRARDDHGKPIMATEIRCDASIRVRDIPGEVLVLDRRNDRVHQLHPTSRLIWRPLDQGSAPEAMVRKGKGKGT